MLPEKVFSYHTSLPVETYKFPTIQCLNCCRYGHIKTQCRSKPRCYKCAQPHTGESCDVAEDNATCLHCSGKHFTTHKSCPEFSRQQSIKIIMSQESISYLEASSRIPAANRSYAEVAKDMFTPIIYSSNIPPKTISSSPIIPISSPYRSYRKTTVRTHRPQASLSKGYDIQAHKAIIGNCPSSQPNGCALNINNNPIPLSNNPSLFQNLIQSLVTFFSTHTDSTLPTNVASPICQLLNALNNVSNQSPSMELSEPTSQET